MRHVPVPEQGALAGAGGARLSRVPRRADQFAKDHVLQISRHVALATRAPAPKPEGSRYVGADRTDHRALAATRQDQPSLAATPLPRQTPEVGAECVSSARSDLSGGRRVKPASLTGWRAVDDEGEVLDVIVQPRRNRKEECQVFCVSGRRSWSLADRSQPWMGLKRSSNMMANWFTAVSHPLTVREVFSCPRIAR